MALVITNGIYYIYFNEDGKHRKTEDISKAIQYDSVNQAKNYMRNFGEFFNNQVEYAGAIIMSRTDIVDEAKAQAALELLREINAKAAIITTPIEKLDGGYEL